MYVHAVGVRHYIYRLCCISISAYSIYVLVLSVHPINLSIQLLFHLSNVPFGTVSVSQPICQSICQSVTLSVCHSISLSVSLSCYAYSTTPSLCRRFSDLSLWDTHRTQTSLLSLLQPSVALDIVQSLVDMYKEGGALPRWPIANGMEQVWCVACVGCVYARVCIVYMLVSPCVYTYVSICVCMLCQCVCVHMYMHIDVCMYMGLCTCLRAYVHINICMCRYVQ